MAIKGTDKIVVIDQSADTTPRKSALINAQAKAQSAFDLTFQEPLAKAFEFVIPAIDAGATETFTFNLGDVNNATSTLMTLFKSLMTISEIETFQRNAASGGANLKELVVGQFGNPEYGFNLTTKYLSGAFPLSNAVRITEDYTEAMVGVINQTNYATASSPYPVGFSYADYGVGSLVGWYSYFGTTTGFAGTDKKIVLQGTWLEQDGKNTNVKVVLNNVDTVANTPATLKIAFYL